MAADHRRDSLPPAGPSRAAAKLRLAGTRPASRISRAEKIPRFLGKEDRGEALFGEDLPRRRDRRGGCAIRPDDRHLALRLRRYRGLINRLDQETCLITKRSSSATTPRPSTPAAHKPTNQPSCFLVNGNPPRAPCRGIPNRRSRYRSG